MLKFKKLFRKMLKPDLTVIGLLTVESLLQWAKSPKKQSVGVYFWFFMRFCPLWEVT